MGGRRPSNWALVVGGFLLALGLAFFVSRYASGSPDGLNKVAIDQGIDGTETEHASAESPLAGYGVEGVDDEGLSTGLSGVIGVAVTFGLGLVIFGLVSRRSRASSGPGDATATISTGAAT